jgi:hypothetical protein
MTAFEFVGPSLPPRPGRGQPLHPIYGDSINGRRKPILTTLTLGAVKGRIANAPLRPQDRIYNYKDTLLFPQGHIFYVTLDQALIVP